MDKQEDGRGNIRLNERRAFEVMAALARMCANGGSITISHDWGFGTGTLTRPDGGHTHFGMDHGEDEAEQLGWFIDGLHGQLVRSQGLSWTKPESA